MRIARPLTTFEPRAYAPTSLARKSDHRVYLLAKAAYGNARHADEARRAAEAVDPPSGHLFVEALDFRRAVHSDAEVADWIAVQSEIHLGADGY